MYLSVFGYWMKELPTSFRWWRRRRL